MRQSQRLLLNASSLGRAVSTIVKHTPANQLTSRRFIVKVLALCEAREKAVSEKIGLTDSQYLPVANQEKVV